MYRIQNRFSRGLDWRYGRTGWSWQSRYEAKDVESQSYFDRLVRDIHLNPMRAGLADHPGEYPAPGIGR